MLQILNSFLLAIVLFGFFLTLMGCYRVFSGVLAGGRREDGWPLLVWGAVISLAGYFWSWAANAVLGAAS